MGYFLLLRMLINYLNSYSLSFRQKSNNLKKNNKKKTCFGLLSVIIYVHLAEVRPARKPLKLLLQPSRKQFPTSQTTGVGPESIQQGVSVMMTIEHHAGQNSRGSPSSSSATSSSHAVNKRFVYLFDYFESFITWGSIFVALKFTVPGKVTVHPTTCCHANIESHGSIPLIDYRSGLSATGSSTDVT